jgi:arginyl-tRNA synthetase
MDLEEKISESLKRIISREFSIPKKSLSLPPLEIPKDPKFGDLSTNVALKLSKDLGKPPSEIASEIVSYFLRESQLLEDIQNLKIAEPGFINFFLKKDYFYRILKEILRKDLNFGRQNLGKGKKVLIEFVSANPTGPLSIAHGRQAAVGDALANILEFCGFRVKREYYLNDTGTQIDLLAKSIQARYKELLGEPTEFPPAGYRGKYIYDIAKEIIDSQKRYETLDLEFFKDFGIRYILDTIKRDLRDFGVKFDKFYSEKALRRTKKIKDTISILKKKGFLYEKDKAIWFKSTEFGDDKDRVIIKGDGQLTYLLPDIAYHRDKFKRGFDWLIDLWGPDHHGYIKRLKSALMALGYGEKKVSIKIIQLATIYREGRLVRISTRKGELMTLREIMDNVGCDSTRFFFLMRRLDSHLDFDLELAKKKSLENPVYYIQYAHARICSILDNVKTPYKKICNSDLSFLKSPFELEILRLISRFGYIVRVCYQLLDPFPLTTYLMDLASSFHRFYEKVRVLGQQEELTFSRVALLYGIKIILKKGLTLLGISAPERM